MATYEFTYKVPDTLWVNSWEDGNTATGKIKSDDPIVKAWIARGGPEPLLLASTFSGINSADSALDTNPIIGTSNEDPGYYFPGYTLEEKTIDLRTASDTMKQAAWHLKMSSTADMDDEEDVPRTYTSKAVPNLSGRTYNDMDNPGPADCWTPDWESWDSDGFMEFNALIKSDLNQFELDAVWRREEVKFYQDKYDLGTEGDSDATAFIAACNAYLTKWNPTKPWMDDGTFRTAGDFETAPKIPLSVVSALGVMKASGAEVESWKANGEWRNTMATEIAELDKGDDIVLMSSV